VFIDKDADLEMALRIGMIEKRLLKYLFKILL
jgi:hypothetical protein